MPSTDAVPSPYQEFRPSPLLAEYIQCYWRLDGGGRPQGISTRVLPDGCVDILFDLGGARGPEGLIIGAMTAAIESQRCQLVGIRFVPGGARAFLSLPMGELTDQAVELGELWPDSAALAEALAIAKGTAEQLRCLETALLARLARGRPLDPRVQHCRLELTRRSYGVTVAELSEQVGMSRQHLRRLFEAEVGLSPKMFIRSMRLQTLVEKVRAADGPLDWATLALEVGFFDQAHMIGDFRALVGLSPTAYFGDGR